MTKKAKPSKYQSRLYFTPFMEVAYGFFPNRESLEHELELIEIPSYLFNTSDISCAATMCGDYRDEQSDRSVALVYVEQMLKNGDIDEPERLSIIAHEAYHVVMHMFNLMNDKPSEETVAYVLTQVTENLFREYFKWKEANGG